MSATIENLTTIFIAKREAITQLDAQLAAERREIKQQAFIEGRRMTDDEIARRKAIGATRMELSEALEELSIATLEGLNSTADVDALRRELEAVNDELKDDLEHLKTIAAYAEKAAKVLSGLQEATEKLVAFGARLA